MSIFVAASDGTTAVALAALLLRPRGHPGGGNPRPLVRQLRLRNYVQL